MGFFVMIKLAYLIPNIWNTVDFQSPCRLWRPGILCQYDLDWWGSHIFFLQRPNGTEQLHDEFRGFFLRKWGYGTQSIFFKTSKVAFWFKLRILRRPQKFGEISLVVFTFFFDQTLICFCRNICSWKTLLSNLSVQILIKYRKVDKAWKILYSFDFYKVCFFHCTISTGYSLSDQHNILPVNPKY